MTQSISILTLLFALSVFALACGGDEPAAAGNPAPAAPAASETGGEVAFEPAYPEEVSAEELSAEDTAQQHQHVDGEVHEHDEEKSTTTTDHGHEH